MSDYTTKKLTIKDLEANWNYFAKIWTDIWGESFWADIKRDRSSIDPYFVKMIENGGGWAVYDQNEVIALMFYTINLDIHSESQEEYNLVAQKFKGVWAFLNELAVMPKYRGKGIGGNLVKIYHDEVIKAGAENSYLYTEVNSASRGLYESLGYSHMVDLETKNKKSGIEKEVRAYYQKIL